MWADININLNKKANGDFSDSLDVGAIENSIGNIWKTLPGSRRMLFPFASPSWGMLFEQIDEITARELGRLLLKAIERWEDRITVSNLHVTADPDNNQYVVQLTYTVMAYGEIEYIYTDVIKPV
jgi:phage baseplate assembly protein W